MDADIHLAVKPGAFVDPGRTIAWFFADGDHRQCRKISAAFTIAHDRAFDQDPRFALVVLSEIASRALSPALNDPGTAIAVLEAGTRVLAALLRHRPERKNQPPARVKVPPLTFTDLIEDLYRPIARDGAAMLEVNIRLQKSLAALQGIEPAARAVCEAEAADALARANAALASDADRERLVQLHRDLWA